MISHPAFYSLACLAIGVTSPPELSAQEADPEQPNATAEHMHEHLANVSAIKAFIIVGSLEGIRQPANWLATHEMHPDLPADLTPFYQFMRSSARQIENAQDLKSAASAAGMMVQNCGSCHSAAHVTVEFGYDQLPAEWSDSETHMQRHQWALTRLWEGLIGPSDAAWERGTTMLSEDALHVDDLPVDVTPAEAEELQSMAEEVHDLGRAAVGLTSATDRGRVAGRILGLCATCHTRTGGGPGR